MLRRLYGWLAVGKHTYEQAIKDAEGCRKREQQWRDKVAYLSEVIHVNQWKPREESYNYLREDIERSYEVVNTPVYVPPVRKTKKRRAS